eukprot:CAMPEP_0206284846 /NCGR_PEP_ID=MMETSP0047_2-20121206/40998_1 /ASSEMBLY_ACC=CAM_ASM_000192 /TAXON_ID=195065 /ORGANISM="Chroomonas mesostigmatica_cf, Strain CCMP1168" /LENGTH=506 /DNA_ID=CAMNT_0053715339 /DNA_START=74 /DNA_END=1592 /DNA_ORIENTATION=-
MVLDSIPLEEITGVVSAAEIDWNTEEAGLAPMTSIDTVGSSNEGRTSSVSKEETLLGALLPMHTYPDPKKERKRHELKKTPSRKLCQEKNSSMVLMNCFFIYTKEGGFNSGRTYVCQMASEDERDEFRRFVLDRVEEAKIKMTTHRWTSVVRDLCIRVHENQSYQAFMTLLIIVNFMVNIVQAEVRPEEYSLAEFQYDMIDLSINIIFMLELAINLTETVAQHLPGITVMRAVRVFRVFGRLGTFKRITSAIMSSIGPILSAYLMTAIIICIFAILGVEFFSVRDPDDFGTFTRSCFTLVYTMTFNTWVPGLPATDPETGELEYGVVVYIIRGVTAKEKDVEAYTRLLALKKSLPTILAPLLECLGSQHENPKDFYRRTEALFYILDANGSGTLSCAEMSEGMRKLPFDPPIIITEEFFDEITEKGKLLDADKGMNLKNFHQMLIRQLRQYVLRHVTNISLLNEGSAEDHAILKGVRTLLMDYDNEKSYKQESEGALRRVETFIKL